MSAVLAPAAPCLRDVLADALWLARAWYAVPEYGNPAKADLYERLHDAVVTAPDDASALAAVRASLADGTAEAGDITAAGNLAALAGAAGGAR